MIPLRSSLAVLLGLLSAAPATLPAAKKPAAADKDAAPVLVSTTGGKGAARWTARSLDEVEAAVARGEPEACFDLGERHYEGMGGAPRNLERARELFLQAAAGGIANAWFRLGKIYHDGLGVKPDRARAYEYYLDAARRGVPEAQYNVGAMLASGRGVRRDFAEGLAWLIIARKSGAEGDGGARLRERLARYPKTIAEGEARALALEAELAGEAVAPEPPVSKAPVVTPSLPTPEAPTIAPPKLDAPPARIGLPVAPLPSPDPGKK